MSTYQKQSHFEYPDYPETPVDQLRTTGTGDHSVPVSNYCDYHKLHSGLLPMPGRLHDPITLLQEISEGLDQLNELAETYMLKDIHGGSVPPKYVSGIHVLFGVTKMHETSKGMRYKNPNYLHYDERINPITDPEERLAFYERHKINPAITGEWLAKHWGLEYASTARNWLLRRDISISADRHEAQQRIARTLCCIREWQDIELKTLYDWLPWKWTTVRSWVSKHVHKADWNVPRDVREAPWFMPSGNGSHKAD